MAMFNKNDPEKTERRSAPPASTENPLSVIAAGMTVFGDIETTGVLKIEGRVEGSVRAARQVLLGRQGEVRGDLNAEEAVIAGRVEGTIVISERVEVQGTATVVGDILAKAIVVLEGAQLNGSVRMGELTPQPMHAQTGIAAVR